MFYCSFIMTHRGRIYMICLKNKIILICTIWHMVLLNKLVAESFLIIKFPSVVLWKSNVPNWINFTREEGFPNVFNKLSIIAIFEALKIYD